MADLVAEAGSFTANWQNWNEGRIGGGKLSVVYMSLYLYILYVFDILLFLEFLGKLILFF